LSDINTAAAWAIFLAKRRAAKEVMPDDLLLGCLCALSRFGVAKLGYLTFDLAVHGVDYTELPTRPAAKVAYSNAVVEIFDQAAKVARADGGGAVRLEHVLVAFANEESGLMGKLRREFQIDSAMWRAAAAELGLPTLEMSDARARQAMAWDYLTPEEAAEALNIHVQTLRAYVRSGKVPALRLAGERAIRIRRADLDKLLEPLTPDS
jgi:excisionase family DNA binding protein